MENNIKRQFMGLKGSNLSNFMFIENLDKRKLNTSSLITPVYFQNLMVKPSIKIQEILHLFSVP